MSDTQPPDLWWSRSLAADPDAEGGLITREGDEYLRERYARPWWPIAALPADAVRLAPVEPVDNLPAPRDWMAWRMRFYAAFTRAELCKRGTGVLNMWRAPDAPEADRMAAAAAEVVKAALDPCTASR